MEDLPEPERAEVEAVLETFRTHRGEILGRLDKMMADRRRGMLFFRWYDSVLDRSIPAFCGDLKYAKTIGVSAFNGKERTSLHFGPLRLTLRVLYNLTARESDDIYIEVNGEKHFWHDDPLFIFDDTIQHRSVNDCDGIRYCVFVDILRPSPVPAFLNACVRIFNLVTSGTKRVFYRNWDMLSDKA
jgi:beta-hydroxylase